MSDQHNKAVKLKAEAEKDFDYEKMWQAIEIFNSLDETDEALRCESIMDTWPE